MARSGAVAARCDAAGAAMGAGDFWYLAMIVWKVLPGRSGSIVLAAATLAWALVAISIWAAAEKIRGASNARTWPRSLYRGGGGGGGAGGGVAAGPGLTVRLSVSLH